MSTVPSRKHGPRHGACEPIVIGHAQPLEPGRAQLVERLGQLRDAVVADQLGLDRVRLALEREHGPGDRLVREIESSKVAEIARHAPPSRSRQMHSDGQRRAHARDSASR